MRQLFTYCFWLVVVAIVGRAFKHVAYSRVPYRFQINIFKGSNSHLPNFSHRYGTRCHLARRSVRKDSPYGGEDSYFSDEGADNLGESDDFENEDDDDEEDDEDEDDGIDNIAGSRSIDDDDWDGIDNEDEDDDDSYPSEDEEIKDVEDNETIMTWKDRIQQKKTRKASGETLERKDSGKTWEEKFLDDPLKCNNPTVEIPVEKPLGRFRRAYIAIGRIEGQLKTDSSDDMEEDEVIAERLYRREQAWLPHMQWARRSVLLDYDVPVSNSSISNSNSNSNSGDRSDTSNSGGSSADGDMGRKVSTAAVTDSYTLLCDLSLRPVAQVLMLRANRSSDARDLLRSEPLAAHGVFEDDWQLLRAEVRDDEDESLSADLRSDPFLFVGLYGNQKKKEQQRGQQFDSSLEYHIAQNTLSEEDPDKIQRVSLLAKLTVIDEEEEEREIQAANADKSDEGQEDDRDSDSASSATSGRNLAGLLVLFSATSVKDAQRYIEADAALSSYSSTVCSIPFFH